MSKLNLLNVAKQFEIEINTIEIHKHGTILRARGVAKLDAMREHLLSNGHELPISCHREHESCESFMILWNQK